MRGKYFSKKSSCVFHPVSDIHCVSMYPAYICLFLHEHVYENATKSPGLVSGFWSISISMYFGWSPLVLLFPSPPVLVPIFSWLYQEHKLKFVPPLLLCSTFFSIPLSVSSTYLSFRFLSMLLCGQPRQQSTLFSKLSFLLIITRFSRLPRITKSICIWKFQMSWCASFSKTDSVLCFYHLSKWSNSNF